MIRAAIVEDIEQDRLNLKKLLEVAGERFQRTFDVSFFGSADAFLLDYKAECDFVFMGIEMPNLDGMTAAKRLREINPAVLLVFFTDMAPANAHAVRVNSFFMVVFSCLAKC
ncbi:MAG: response regulator [Bacilli bacterium]|nr:response regulator [Bacilli bacterium]